MSEAPTPEYVYDKVWRPIVERTGEPDWAVVKILLSDYAALLSDTSVLYYYLTEGAIDDPQEPLTDVIEISDRLVADSIDTGIRTVLGELLSELDRTSAATDSERLDAVVQTINSLYEQGLTDATA